MWLKDEVLSYHHRKCKNTLPVPPNHERLNFLLLIVILQKFEYAVIKSFRVGHCICSREYS